ncbi:hypothetical protein [Streptomyces venezuelae]|uniref:hypothetical protein n=1 Tax=Streptomyces venezuelae TaxID=54571 RepID=UPI0037CE68BB
MPSHDRGPALSRRGFRIGGAACAGALAVPTVAGAARAADGYTLTVTNDSTRYQDLCVYQQPAGLGVPGALSRAWLTAPAWPGTTATFTWSPTYSFVMAVTGALAPGGLFSSWREVAADPSDPLRNRIEFDHDHGKFAFAPATGPGHVGALEIDVTSDVPRATASVGIGMSDAPVFAAQAVPGTTPTFTPNPQYWITAGAFTQGMVLDTEEITEAAPVPFDNTSTMRAVLDPNGPWTVTPG